MKYALLTAMYAKVSYTYLHQWRCQDLLSGGANDVGVWGGGPENFLRTTLSTLAINVINAPLWVDCKINESVEVTQLWYNN